MNKKYLSFILFISMLCMMFTGCSKQVLVKSMEDARILISIESRSAAWNYLVIMASTLIFHKRNNTKCLDFFR
jgi:hypothetical protein